jgi:hypothetical protein
MKLANCFLVAAKANRSYIDEVDIKPSCNIDRVKAKFTKFYQLLYKENGIFLARKSEQMRLQFIKNSIPL